MKSPTVEVPAQVLQDLIHNVELMVAGQGHRAIEVQCSKLQRYLDSVGRKSQDTGFIHRDNITFAAFGGK